MQTIDIMHEIQRLPLTKKFYVLEEIIKSIKKDEFNNQMEFAASELYAAYANDKDLTAFTSLDFEHFYEAKWGVADWPWPNQGTEIQKKRPAIIVNDDRLGKLPFKVVIPITEWKERYDIAPWMVKIEPNITNGLSKESAADCFQIRSLSQERLLKKLGHVDINMLQEIKEAIRKVIDL